MTALTLTDVQLINALAWKESIGAVAIAERTALPLDAVRAVLDGTYIEDIREQFRDPETITLADYNKIRQRYQKGSAMHGQYALARELLIDPSIVLRIVKSQFSNSLTHPQAAPAKAAKPAPKRAPFMYGAVELEQAIRLMGNLWKPGDCAAKFGGAPEAYAKARHLRVSHQWNIDDIVIEVNRLYGTTPTEV